MSFVRRLAALAALSTVAWYASAAAQTATLELLAPDSPAGTVVPDTQYDLRVNYAFAGGNVVNPRLVVDLPPGVILVDVGVFSAFTGTCTYENATGQTYTNYLDWKCTFTAAAIEVASGGVSGQIPLRVRFMPHFFQNQQVVPLTATMSGDNFATVTATDTSVVATTLGFYENGWSHTWVGFTRESAASAIGPFAYHYRSPDNSGTQFVHPGLEVRETFPAGTKYLKNIYPSASWVTTATPWSDAAALVHTTPDRFGYSYVNLQSNGALGSKGLVQNTSAYLYAFLWNACDSVPAGTNWTSQLWGSTAPDGSGFAQFVPANYPGAFTSVQSSAMSVPNCTDPVGTGFSLGTPALGSWFQGGLYLRPPSGVVPAYDVYGCYALPAGLETRYPNFNTNYYNSTTWQTAFPVYRCAVPARAGATFPQAEFDTYLQSGACVAWARNDATVRTDVTHVVTYAPVASALESWGETVWMSNYLTVQLRKNTCSTETSTIAHAAYTSARRSPNTSLLEASQTTTQSLDNRYYYYHYTYARSLAGADITTSVKAASARIQLQMSADPGLNPSGTTTLPAGFRLLDHRWRSNNSQCDVPSYALAVRPMPNGTTEIDVDLGPDTAPWSIASDCVNAICQPAGSGSFEFDFYIDPAYPFTDGQVVTFSSRWTTDNNRHSQPLVSTDTLTIAVPAAMDLRIEPTCSGSAGTGDRQLGVLARMTNSGGLPLTGVGTTLPVPKQGDGSGSQVNTSYAGHFAPEGVTVDCSTNGGQSWSASCTAAATHVRFTAGTLAAYAAVDVELYLSVPGTTPTGTSVYAIGSLDSAELLPINSESVAPSQVNLCPGQVTLNLWFDEDGDGSRDATEPALANWPLQITSPQGEVFDYAFAPDGTLALALPGGTSLNPQRYTFAVTNPTTGDAVWSWTTDIPADIPVAADDNVTVNLPATCACDDNVFCTTDTCNFLGQCIYRDRDPIPNVADAVCDGIDNNCDGQADEDYEPLPVTCGFGACQAQGASTCVGGVEDRALGTCTPNLAAAVPEVCDGQDNDCDGLTDAQDASLTLISCTRQGGVCNGAKRPRDLCVPAAGGATWLDCTDAVYAAHAYPRAFVNPSLNADRCGDPLSAAGAGVDNDCDGLVDEDHVRTPTVCGTGACAAQGELACVNGATVDTCESGDAGVEICNGQDDDCDGLIDSADAGLVRENCANQLGVCQGAKKAVCNGAAGWSECTIADYAGHGAPNYATTDTSCDAKDNDCSGQVDEDFVGGPVACGAGVCAVSGVQVCAAGVVRVQIGGATYASCTPNAAAATSEVCDSLDNDCDGAVDAADASLALVACEQQSGACAGATKPRTLCVAGGWQPCNASTYAAHSAAYSASDTSCDGVDNDCGGGVDEDYEAPMTLCGVGGCTGTTGRLECVGGVAGDDTCDPYAAASAERCNGQDDDCDGSTDEEYAVGEPCSVGQYACTSAGQYLCSADGQGVVCDAPVINGAPERCNAEDDDCDGQVDEGFDLGASCAVGVGACAREGVRVCHPDGSAGCDAVAAMGSAEVCDTLDNDCDGLVDEGVCQLDTAITAGPDAVVAVSEAHFSFNDPLTPGATRFECQLDGGGWFDCDGGALTVSELGDGAHTLLVRAVGPTGVVDDTPAYWSWEVDTTAPDTFVLAGPQDPAQTPDADFVFGTTVAAPSAWYCALDPPAGAPTEADWAPCAATWSWSDLPDGEHTVWVYVVSELGVADTTPAQHTWVIDTTAPGTSIFDGPALVTCDGAATFAFGAPDDDNVTLFRCRLDDLDWAACPGGSAHYDGLADGLHTFAVASVDANGNADPTPAQATWTVDTVAPDTRIDLGPQDPAQTPSASFAFSANEPGATFACALDDAPLAPCTSPVRYEDLTDGTHTFSVVAADAGCMTDASPATLTWLIDTRFPDTAFVTTPPILNGHDDANDFTFEDPTDPELSAFSCALDGAAWAPCDDGALAAGVLEVGSHTLMVRSCLTIGETLVQCDPTPAVYTWQVTASPCPLDREAPALSCAADVVVECAAGGGVVDLEALAATATDACAPVEVHSDASAAVPLGTSPLVFEASDGNGNLASCITRVTVVDTAAPSLACPPDVTLSAPADACGLAYALAAPEVSDACYGASVSVFSNAPAVFGVGETVVALTALDGSGQTASCTTVVTVVDETPVTLECEPSVTRVAPADACAWSGALTATASDNCAVDVTVVDRTNTYAVGEQEVEFTAEDDSGNADSCTTVLTVVDETLPALSCGVLAGLPPATVTASATDACGAVAVVSGFTCVRVAADGTRTELADADCPVRTEGAALTIERGLAEGALELSYGVEATDPSGNRASAECQLVFDADADGDGAIDGADNCPATANADQRDGDDDGLGDACDVCPAAADPGQADVDADGVGDACQDRDTDGVLDLADNCPDVANADQGDYDEDGIGNACDSLDEDIAAVGGGGCAGGPAGGALALALAALALAVRQRRRAR